MKPSSINAAGVLRMVADLFPSALVRVGEAKQWGDEPEYDHRVCRHCSGLPAKYFHGKPCEYCTPPEFRTCASCGDELSYKDAILCINCVY